MLGEDYQISVHCRCWKAAEEPHDYMVLEDLNKSGFKMANRFEKLDHDHAMKTLAKLAKFHATSLVFKEKVKIITYILIKTRTYLIYHFHRLAMASN